MLPTAVVAKLSDVPRRVTVRVESVEGSRGFRRRLMEMGLVPGTTVMVTNVAPLGDPLEIEVRASRWSIRKSEASQITVAEVSSP